MKFLTNRSHIHILPTLMPLTFDFSPLTWMERLSWFSCILWEGGRRSWVSLWALLWSASHMEAVHYLLEGLDNRCYKADKQTHTPWAQSLLSQALTHLPIPIPGELPGWWRDCALRGKRCSKALLMSLYGHAVFSACHHGWDSAACLLLRMHWHFSGAYPRILLSGWRLNEALPGDRGRKLHHPSGALLCAGCHPNCYCKYRNRLPSLLSDTEQHFLFAFSLLSSLPGHSPATLSGESCFSQNRVSGACLVFYKWILLFGIWTYIYIKHVWIS